jgi:galactokinase
MATTKDIYAAHKKEYGENPKVVISTPGRFHLMGEHSCWFFKDKTLSMAINIPVYVAVSLRDDTALKFHFVQLKERKKADISNLKVKKEDRWANILKAVVYGYISSGIELKGMDFTVYSEILPSAGFGITSAIKAGTALAIKKAQKINLEDSQLLQVLDRGNRLFLKTRNLIADNFAALYSEPNSMILTDYGKQTYENIPFDFSGYKILLTDAKVPRFSIWNEDEIREPEHALLLGDLKERKKGIPGGWVYDTNPTNVNEMLSVVSEDMRQKLLYIIHEHGMILDALDGIKKGKFTKFARAVNNSHKLLQENYKLSCPEIDWILKRVGELEPNLVDIREPVTCGRITGKGFGRCLYAIIRNSDEEVYRKKLDEYSRIFGFEAETFEVKPAKGAHQVRLS